MNNKRKTGTHYEERAAAALIAAGYKLLARNYYFPGGEIDIIAQKNRCIVFIEVRFRSNKRYGPAIASITKTKRHRIRLGARHYLMEKDKMDNSVRFDLIFFDGEAMTHLKNCM